MKWVIGSGHSRIPPQAPADLEVQIRRHRDVTEVEQPMEVRAEEKAVVDFMHTSLRVGPDVGCLENGVLLSDRARSTVRISDGHPERSLSEAWPNQH